MTRVKRLQLICAVAAFQCLIIGRASAVEKLLYSVRIDGTGLRVEVPAEVYREYAHFGSPDVSPDGGRLLFDAAPLSENFSQSKILMMGIAGESKGEIIELDCGNCPVWSPDGKQFTFSVYPGNPRDFAPGSWIINADGSNPTWIAEGYLPRWTPDGKSLVVLSANGQMKFEKVDIASKESRPFLDQYTHVKPIRWSPDGKRLLAYIERGGMNRLVTMAANGDENSIIELANGRVRFAEYSPDGKWVSYVKWNDVGGNNIYLVNPDGKTAAKELIVAPNVQKEDFCWLKDGSRILFNAPGKLPVED